MKIWLEVWHEISYWLMISLIAKGLIFHCDDPAVPCLNMAIGLGIYTTNIFIRGLLDSSTKL